MISIIRRDLLVLVFYVFASVDCGLSYYNYEEKGPGTWPFEIPECAGRMQSPIDIQDSKAIFDPELKPFYFTNYDSNILFNTTIYGHTISFNPLNNTNLPLKISGSNFTESYSLLQFHFHWGENNYQGSEHYFDGKKYPLEMHLVHMSDSKSIAVLGFVFNISDENNSDLDPLIDGIRNIERQRQVELTLSNIILSKQNLRSYYRYMGSLTTPPCLEGLIWTVFEVPIQISSQQLQVFSSSTKIKKNFRDPQRLNCREVTSSKRKRNPTPKPCTQNFGLALVGEKLKHILFFVILIDFLITNYHM